MKSYKLNNGCGCCCSKFEMAYWKKEVEDAIKDLKIKIVENDIFTADEIFRVIDDVFSEKIE